ncbi:MAG: hypothetical protein LBK99_09125 [Opitutaceae bacterium]|nr:hypothetical protein [Opitutaceae bacterium]
MKIQILHGILTGSLLLLPAFLSPLPAQTFLSVDIGAGNNPAASTIQAGFASIGIPTGATTGPIERTLAGLDTEFTATGTVVFTIASGNTLAGTGQFLTRDRGTPSTDSGSFTYSDIYRDTVLRTGSNANGATATLGFSGLNANTLYEIRFFTYDNDASSSRTMTFTDWTTGVAGNTGSITFTGGYIFTDTTDNHIFSTTITATTDASGKLLIRETPGGSYSALLNGFQLTHVSAAVPESAATALMATGAVCLAILLYRRTAHTGKN